MHFFIIFIILLFPFISSAGSANANLHCISPNKTNELEIQGNIPGDYAEFKLEITQKKIKHIFLSDLESNKTSNNIYLSKITIVNSLKNKVWTLDILTNDGHKNLQLFALPETVDIQWLKNDAYKAKFKAMIIRHFSGKRHKQEPLDCTLEQYY
ncbi:MAG TPA: hypothetical protein PKC21_02970 [Oligoflexia bacterium]|nr:hypothetical protein [Oligoflexia bacterium]HMR24295.1 hypothetical protein [Oligoflexia bacterium]